MFKLHFTIKLFSEMKDFSLDSFLLDGSVDFDIHQTPTKVNDFYADKDHYEAILEKQSENIDELQNIMYAQNRYGMLVIFQAMDAAGKDGTMKAVFKNVHPLGLSFYSFKRPSETELNHDFLWRCFKQLPERGKIMVFNRSYYEEVLVVKVHPEILKNSQRLPNELTENLSEVWENRYTDIKNFEQYLANNGIKVVKIFLHVSKQEQGKRLIERIEDPTKNWKFEAGDIKERESWNEYMDAFQMAINKTATKTNPWYIVPADDKKNMRLIVSKIILENLQSLSFEFPKLTFEQQVELKNFIEIIQEQDRI